MDSCESVRSSSKNTHTGAGSRKRNLNERENNCKTVSEKCGYILWKDRKVVVFNTNDFLLFT